MAKTKKISGKATKHRAYDGFKCKFCSKRFTEKSGLNHHLQLHTTDRPYTCPHCTHTSKTKKYLSRHIKTVHNPGAEECEVCGKKFHFKCLLVRHMLIHTDTRPFKCDVCGKGFNSQYSLSTHKLIHTDSKPFKCSFCDYACRDASTLRRHEERHMGIKKRYECRMCSRSYKTKSILKIHIAEVHMDIDVKNSPCTMCEKIFKSASRLNSHIKIVHKRIYSCKCDICGMVISNRYNMASHLTKHAKYKPFVCSFEKCGKRFKEKGGLKKHSIIHYPDQQHPCLICGKRFARLHRLQKHAIQHREKIKCVFCDYCGKGFYNKNYLVTHITRKHFIKQQYICDVCGLLTYNKPSIVMHLKYGHLNENDRKCKICKKKYKKHQYLKMHYWNTHCVKYKVMNRRPPKRRVVIKEEPKEYKEIELLHEVKVEHLSDSEDKSNEYSKGVLSEDVSRALLSKEQTPLQHMEDFFIEHIIKSTELVPEVPENMEIDKKTQRKAKKHINKLLVRARRKNEMRELEKARQVYNERIRKASEVPIDTTKIKYIKIIKAKQIESKKEGQKELIKEYLDSIEKDKNIETGNDKKKYVNTQDVLENNDEGISVNNNDINDSDDNKNIETINHRESEVNTQKILGNTTNDEDMSVINNEIDESNYNKHIESVNDRQSDVNTQEVLEDNTNDEDMSVGNNEMNDSDYFPDMDDSVTVKNKTNKFVINTHQCYICFKLYETKEKLLEHCQEHFDVCNSTMLKKCPLCDYVTRLNIVRHLKNIHKINIKMQYNIKDRKNNNDGSRFYYEIDNNKVDKIEVIPSVKNLNKQAYVRIDKRKRELNNKRIQKTKLVKKNGEWIVEKLNVNVNDYIIPKIDDVLNVGSNDYFGRLKRLSVIAKKDGKKIMYPCEKCEKICQTLSALKLHSRKHEDNPKPFKPKVWKHKLEAESNPIKKTIPSKSRYEKPKPIVNNHKCDPKLRDFYENNIKGGDIEFWQFLKIFNKMSRENINDFEDLENRTDFGIHYKEKDIEEKKQINDQRAKDFNIRKPRKVAFIRTIMISKKEYNKRKILKEKLRNKNNANNLTSKKVIMELKRLIHI